MRSSYASVADICGLEIAREIARRDNWNVSETFTEMHERYLQELGFCPRPIQVIAIGNGQNDNAKTIKVTIAMRIRFVPNGSITRGAG